jgi:hypothetical protein
MTQQTGTTPTAAPIVTAPDATASTTPTTLPSVPKIIIPANGIPQAPQNSTLVRIGFLEALNYPFVVQHSVTVAQIFQTLPIGVGYGLQVPVSELVAQSLQPYSMARYTATVAMFWIPSDKVDSLQVQLLAANSRLYSQTDATAQQLVDLIDNTIPLLADGATANPGGSTGQSNLGVSTGSTSGVTSGR